MDPASFNDLPSREQDWLDAYLDGTIEPEAFEALQARMRESPQLRSVMRRYLALDHSLQDEGGMDVETASGVSAGPWLRVVEAEESRPADRARRLIRFPGLVPVAAAATLAFFLGLAFMELKVRRDTSPGSAAPAVANAEGEEPFAEGFAVIGRLFDVEWAAAESSRREGDTLGAERFRIAAGTAEIQFFSGATMTVEGPAEIFVKSAWEAVCAEGAMRMRVPPGARGFKLHAPSTEIVDLGTEFGLVVRGGKGHVEVFDGEIALRPEAAEAQVLKKGSALELAPDGPPVAAASGQVAFPDVNRFGSRAVDEQRLDFERWRSHRDALAQDGRLIAFYTFDRDPARATIANMAVPRNSGLDGAVVLAEPVDGRWPGLKSALEFRRPGARVRVNIPGEFPAFTFACWVRIDSLDRWYNALFMGDGYETGEPHWQIRNDGKMMLSVMVDDLRPHPRHPQTRFHHVYFSPPMWDLSMSGQWLHLASVFDPANRRVSHYRNGERLSREEIEDEFFIETLRIGNGEIGNWGQPFREDPTFAIRNLNGRMDELAIFDAALGDDEIADLFARSRAERR